MNEIRLGTIGSGSIVHAVLDGMMKAENLRLEAVYSRSWEKGEKLAKEYGAQKVYTSLEEMFADEEINTVYIASPNILHYEQSKMALLAGKHVICEKPFCTRKEQALELIALAKEKGLYLRPRYSPGYGDFPLTYQKEILELLNAQRRIGLTRTESNMLVPTKSVTAIIGFTTEETSCHVAKCMTCQAKNCPFRKE